VGTFYRSASPGSDAFVEIGSVVKAGAPVCIIEAMKIMNEIEADSAGAKAGQHLGAVDSERLAGWVNTVR
ncbi:MAG: acetyl-CoA carboxylase biotin carboxyl carrier protein, partial [Caldimonas sp.]